MGNASIDWVLQNQERLKTVHEVTSLMADSSSHFLLRTISDNKNLTMRELAKRGRSNNHAKTKVFRRICMLEQYGFIVGSLKKEQFKLPPNRHGKQNVVYVDNDYGENIFTLNIDQLVQLTSIFNSVKIGITCGKPTLTKDIFEINFASTDAAQKLSLDCQQLRNIKEIVGCFRAPMITILEKLSVADYIDKELAIHCDESTAHRRLKKLEYRELVERQSKGNFILNSLHHENIDTIVTFFKAIAGLKCDHKSSPSTPLSYKAINKIMATVSRSVSQQLGGRDTQ